MATPVTPSVEDLAHLERARILARRGWGHAHPNPLVGCVIVRDGRVVGEGWHAVFGGPHAEIVALEDALTQAEGATAYVSLEPCDHHGKTPPCSEALVTAGVKRVVIGAAEPGLQASGGAETLRKSGVEVVGPLWTDAEARAENPAFMHTARHGTPFLALKLAMTLDARIAAAPGLRTRITGLEAEREAHRLRTGFDALLVGAGTAQADDPSLTVRLVAPGRVPPRRIVLDPDAVLPSDAALLVGGGGGPVHIFVRRDAAEAEMERLEEAGAHVHPVDGEGAALDLDEVLNVCGALGIGSILCEGGATLAASLLREARVQRLHLFVASSTLGADGLAAFPDDAGTLEWRRFEPAGEPEWFGRDLLLTLDRQEG